MFTISIRRDSRKKESGYPGKMHCYLKTGSLFCTALLALAAVVIPNASASSELQRRKAARVKRVDELFNRNCARCHGADGRSETPQGKLFLAPNFTDAAWWKKNSRLTSNRTLRTVIIRGKATMPAFGKKLTRSEIDLLVERIRSFRQSER